MFATKSWKTLLAAGAVALAAGTAAASTCSLPNFTTSIACVSPVTGGPGGNVTAGAMNAGTGVFNLTNWTKLASIGSANSGVNPQQSFPFLFSFSYDDGLQSGTWSLNPAFTWGTGSYAFALKGATDNAVYLMNKSFTSGTWNVADLDLPNSEGDPELSNVRVFGTAPLASVPVPVPVPAAGFLMIVALGGLAALRLRRRAV